MSLFNKRRKGLLNSMRRSVAGCRFAIALVPWVAYAEPAVPQAAAGTTVETAIVLPNIADEFHGVAAEHTYIAQNFSTWHIENQAHIAQNGRDYDRIGMIRPDGSKTAIFFDITEWIGK
jgi:P2-related tail formation protein